LGLGNFPPVPVPLHPVSSFQWVKQVNFSIPAVDFFPDVSINNQFSNQIKSSPHQLLEFLSAGRLIEFKLFGSAGARAELSLDDFLKWTGEQRPLPAWWDMAEDGKSKMDDYDGDDEEEGRSGSGTEEEDKGRCTPATSTNPAPPPETHPEGNDFDGESQEETIRKLLHKTLPGSSKGAIDHVPAHQDPPSNPNVANSSLPLKPSPGISRVGAVSSSGAGAGENGHRPRMTGAHARPHSADQAKSSRGEEVKETKLSLSARRHPAPLSVLVKSHSVSVTEDRKDSRYPTRHVRKLSSSMSRLLITSQSSPNVSRRASCGTPHQEKHPGSTGGSFKLPHPGQHYYSSGGHCSLSPSPSPQGRRHDVDPLTRRRLYLLHRNDPGSAGSSIRSERTGASKLNLPASRPSSAKSTPHSSLKERQYRPLARGPVNHSFYRDCRSNSFAFSMDVKNSGPLKDLPPREQRHRKVGYAIIIISSVLLSLAVLCIVISLHFSSLGNKGTAGKSNSNEGSTSQRNVLRQPIPP